MSIAKWLLAKKLGGGSPFPPVIKRVTGNPIEFTDGADAPLVKCVTQITGSQDLHGYDKPWVGGAGKNKLPMTVDSIKFFNTSAMGYTWVGNSCYVFGVTYTLLTDDGDNVIGIKATSNGAASGMATLYVYGSNTSTSSNISISNDMLCTMGLSGSESTFRGIVWKESGGQFIDGGTVAINANDTLYGFGIRVISGYTVPSGGIIFLPMIRPSGTTAEFQTYSNICPITAYTEGEIEVRGKNIFDKTATDTSNGYVANAYIRSNGSIQSDSDCYVSEYIEVEYNTDYIIENVSGNNVGYAFYDEEKNYISGGSYGLQWGVYGNATFTTPANAKYVRVSVVITKEDVTQLEKGSTATPYEPYTSTTHTTTFPSAIYRGSEDVVNGKVTSEWKKVVFDGTENWQQASVDRPTCFILDGDLGFASIWGQTLDNGFSNYLVADNESAYAGRGPSFAYVNNRLYVGFPSASSLSDFTTYLSNNNLEICGLLATPTTSSVTPTNLPIKSLSGYNHIESSTGDMEIDYITDAYQNFVDTVESALPNTNTRNLLTASKGGTKAMDIFLSLEKRDDKKEEVKEETKDDMR